MSEILLSEEEKYYLVMGVAANIRVDGRGRLDYRSGEMESDVISNSHGSLRIKLAETEIIIATQMDIDEPDPRAPDQGKIKFLVDCSPTASPDFEGRGGDQLAETICDILSSAYVKSAAINLKSLCIIPKRHCYVIGVDILVLQCGGNLIDVISMGVKLCLGICEIPKITGTRSDLGQPTPIMTQDEYMFSFLDVSSAPIIITFPRIGHYFVVDATQEEESVSKGKLAIGISPDGKITSVDKLGKTSYHIRSISSSIKMASKVGIKLNKLLTEKLEYLKSERVRNESANIEDNIHFEIVNNN